MCIPKDGTQNYPFSRLKLLNTQVKEPTNQNFLWSPKFLSQRIRKRNYKILGTLNSPLSPIRCLSYVPFIKTDVRYLMEFSATTTIH